MASEYLSESGKNVSRIVPSGSTAVCCIGTIGKCGYLLKDGTTNQQINSIIPYINKKYVFYYCTSDFFIGQLNIESSATTITIVNKSKMSNILIPIPPFQEQQRIVQAASIRMEYVSIIETEKSSLLTTIQLVKSKILDLAIRGKLVPQDPNDESASVLLERIRTEKEDLIRQGKIKRDKKESVIFRGEDNSYYLKSGDLTKSIDDWGLDDIPDNWDICCLGELCDYGNCVSVDTSTIKDNAWILDLEDIEKDTGKVLAKIYKSDRNSASTKHRFKKGQVLYSKLRPYLNKVVIADEDGYCTSEIIPLELNPTITPDYMRYYLMSNTFLRYANHCSYGVKMPRLGTADGKKAVISLPPINEQKRITAKIAELFSMLDTIETSLE